MTKEQGPDDYQPEVVHALSDETFGSLYQKRREVGYPFGLDPVYAKKFLGKAIPLAYAGFETAVNNPENIAGLLPANETERATVSDAELTAGGVLTYLYMPTLDAAKHFAEVGHQEGFVMWFDVAMGMGRVAISVHGAAAAVRGETNADFRHQRRLVQEFTDVSKDSLFASEIDERQKLEAYRALLEQDPTGLTLVHSMQRSIQKDIRNHPHGKRILPYEIPYAVSAGADAAVKGYKKLLPLINPNLRKK